MTLAFDSNIIVPNLRTRTSSLNLSLFAVYLDGDASAALQIVARGHGDGGGDGRRRAGFQAVAGTYELRQGLQGVDPQLNELTLERKWT